MRTLTNISVHQNSHNASLQSSSEELRILITLQNASAGLINFQKTDVRDFDTSITLTTFETLKKFPEHCKNLITNITGKIGELYRKKENT